MTRPVLLALALLAATGCLPLPARDLVRLDVVDRDDASVLPQLPHRGDAWVAGVPGHRYAVRLANTTGERVLVVLSVDGVNAVTGETAAPGQAGYVLEPWGTAEITGWRKSLDDVAAFVFTDVPDSYAARTGRPGDVGVIGIAVFRERVAPPVYAPLPAPPPIASGRTREQAASKAAATASADNAMAEAAPRQLGTGHGQREWAPVGQTGFVRASRSPQQLSQLRYDDAAALAARGILPRHWIAERRPMAFPGGFVAAPPGE